MLDFLYELNFSLIIGYIDSLKVGCFYLQYVPASKPLDHALFAVLKAITLYCTVLDPISGNFKAS